MLWRHRKAPYLKTSSWLSKMAFSLLCLCWCASRLLRYTPIQRTSSSSAQLFPSSMHLEWPLWLCIFFLVHKRTRLFSNENT